MELAHNLVLVESWESVGSRARQESKGQRVTRDSKVELQEYRGVWESVGSRAR